MTFLVSRLKYVKALKFKGSGTLLVRLYKDAGTPANEWHCAHLVNFDRLGNCLCTKSYNSVMDHL